MGSTKPIEPMITVALPDEGCIFSIQVTLIMVVQRANSSRVITNGRPASSYLSDDSLIAKMGPQSPSFFPAPQFRPGHDETDYYYYLLYTTAALLLLFLKPTSLPITEKKIQQRIPPTAAEKM